MTDILNELNNGKIDFLLKLSCSDRKYTINEIIAKSDNRKEILNKILPIFREDENWFGLAYEIFKLIYLDNDFKEYTFYLLHNQYVILEDMSEFEIKNILEKTTWGLDYIINNLDSISDNILFNKRMNIIIDYVKSNPDFYQQLFQKIISCSNRDVKDQFIMSSLTRNITLDKNILISSLYQNPVDYFYHQETLPFCVNDREQLAISQIPFFLLFYAKQDDRIKQMMIDNIDLFIKAESKYKMQLFEYFYNYLSEEVIDKYSKVYELYKMMPDTFISRSISIFLNSDFSNYFLDLLKDKEISYLSSGSTTYAFKVNDQVLKFSLQKHEFNTVKDLFLIAPTVTKTIYDKTKKPILTVEIQDYLDKEYNGVAMSKIDVDHFLEELDNLGYCVTDPNCMIGNFDNFGFLKDYHDATLVGVNSYEELPEWFKERPIVLYDVDLVYRKDEKTKKIFIK